MTPANSDIGSSQAYGKGQTIGKYRVIKLLGQGSFGLVYHAWDEDAQREVAIKVPHTNRITRPEDAESFLAEARVLSGLDHPNIVPIYEVSRTTEGLIYLVLKFIKGVTLTEKLTHSRPSFVETAQWVAETADAAHHAHLHKVTHRDIKPANILIDEGGKAYLTDFGLALKDMDFGKGAVNVGSPDYLSPEQARGESHRVDGRSDIFSLGIILYELLTLRKPFSGESESQVIEQIKDFNFEPRPPRMIDYAIPNELERICLKALEKKRTQRYSNARDFAEDLRSWQQLILQARLPSVPQGEASHQAARVRPKGLRAFDADDNDFFLALLPGVKDRNGLPPPLGFWKRRIEDVTPDNTFRVGVIYGVSGCGKTSLVRAGLLPSLAGQVVAITIQATRDQTVTGLLTALRRKFPGRFDTSTLTETLAALRHGEGLGAGQKCLLVLDQFEQWLHAPNQTAETELVTALRQCDGQRVQCLVLVRGDFYPSLSRFMQTVEIPLVEGVEGENVRLLDLFNERHARQVLIALGQGYECLPQNAAALTPDQNQFLERVVTDLASDGKIIPVQLALFAVMVSDKSWTSATLKDVGGIEGVGVKFLDKTFSERTALPKHKPHLKAATAVLKTLLPEPGTDIKGQMRSYHELLEASGYAGRPGSFDDLLSILDQELRLVTPTYLEGVESTSSELDTATREKYYQLTHDYLVPSLRDWLNRKQTETMRGRAEIRLAERSAAWNVKPENRHLPAWWEWLNICLFTRTKWTDSQRKMMRKATEYHAWRGTNFAAVILMVTIFGLDIWRNSEEKKKASHAAGLVQQLLNADTAEVPRIVAAMQGYRQWTDPLLRQACTEPDEIESADPMVQNAEHLIEQAEGFVGQFNPVKEKQRLENKRMRKAHRHLLASLALLPVDSGQLEYLYGRLLDAEPQEVVIVIQGLADSGHGIELMGRLWTVVEQPKNVAEIQRLRAACALAKFDPENDHWANAAAPVVEQLVSVSPFQLTTWVEALRPVRHQLLTPLATVFRDHKGGHTSEQRYLATNILADYAADNVGILTGLVADADERQFAMLFPILEKEANVLSVLGSQEVKIRLEWILSPVQIKLPGNPAVLVEPQQTEEEKETLAKQKANAAIALFRLGEAKETWLLLKHSPDPRVRSYLIHRLAPLGADASAIAKRLDEEQDVTIRRALILSLGEFDPDSLAERPALIAKLLQTYREAVDPGLHGAAEWLLRHWKQDDKLKESDEQLKKEKEQRIKQIREYLAGRDAASPEANPVKDARWYVNGEGQTMVVVPGPVTFQIGSPPAEGDRYGGAEGTSERQVERRIGRSFAIATKAVTVEEFQRFRQDHKYNKRNSNKPNCPMNEVTWCDAAAYCNWLSKREGLQAVYEPNKDKEYGPGMKLNDNYLQLSGYRLPTESEWEYACRAEAVTSRYYGETAELLGKYAWYQPYSLDRWMLPVGSLKPNDLGLFDMLGNVWQWCEDRPFVYYAGGDKEDREDIKNITNNDFRVLRGGSFDDQASGVHSAHRNGDVAANPSGLVGFRLARTFTP